MFQVACPNCGFHPGAKRGEGTKGDVHQRDGS
jgi:hypothetical protein